MPSNVAGTSPATVGNGYHPVGVWLIWLSPNLMNPNKGVIRYMLTLLTHTYRIPWDKRYIYLLIHHEIHYSCTVLNIPVPWIRHGIRILPKYVKIPILEPFFAESLLVSPLRWVVWVFWVVVSNVFYVHPYLGKIPLLTNIFSNGLKPPTRYPLVLFLLFWGNKKDKGQMFLFGGGGWLRIWWMFVYPKKFRKIPYDEMMKPSWLELLMPG